LLVKMQRNGSSCRYCGTTRTGPPGCDKYSLTGFFVAALLIGTQGCSETNNVDIASCFADKSGMTVAKIDEKNHRVFAVPKQQAEDAIVGQVRSAAGCFSDSSWSKDWSVSLFTSDKYAGYKDEPHIIPYHKNNEWAKAYLGEYDGSSQTYTSFPAMSGRRDR